MRIAAFGLLPSAALVLLASCRGGDASPRAGLVQSSPSTPSPCPVALAPQSGSTQEDTEITRLQRAAQSNADAPGALERLGWVYVEKARLSYDPGYYKLAEQTALCLEAKQPGSPKALLLRGHALHNLHRFAEMETLARKLVATRGEAFDYALLGDALLEQGRIDEAIDFYQRMVDMKPGLQAYSRIAHVRWLMGDLAGAIKIMRMAADAGSPRNRESVAWARSRLALFELQAGNSQRALAEIDGAVQLVPDYAPALLVRGRILLARGAASEAVDVLKRAAAQSPLPEYEWALADALRAAGRISEAWPVEARLVVRGADDDPRTYALYLATRGEKPDVALRLAREELTRRADAFTLDALAWSLAAADQPHEAYGTMQRALAVGTADARLFYHAGVIAGKIGREQEARRWLRRARAIQQMLLPSEREQLVKTAAAAGAGEVHPERGPGGSEVRNGPSTQLSNARR